MSDKPKCPVFGCTIPRGIAHEHPAGVSAVMLDPVAPLSGDERYREATKRDLTAHDSRLRESIMRQNAGLQDCSAGSPLYDRLMGTKLYVVSADAPMVPSRKLRDALIMGGANTSAGNPGGEWLGRNDKPSRSFVRSVGRFAFWMIVGAASIAFSGLAIYVRINGLAWWWS